MKNPIRILFILLSVSMYHPCMFSQSSFDEQLFKEAAKEIFLQGIKQYNEDIDWSNTYSGNKKKSEKFQLTDTANIEFSIPILTLKSLSHNGNVDNLRLIDLIDYNYDPYSQLTFIGRKTSVEILYIHKGICQRWEKKMMENLEKKDFEDYRIPPGYSDSTLSVSSTIELGNSDQKFNYVHFKAYLQDRSDVEVFRIYPMKELWALNNGKLKKLSFSKAGVKEEDGETYFSNLLKKYGVESLENVIAGGEWEKIIVK
ncbi:hypothetical protein [Massilibacteroides sp.]|uniref:hypothetical protein n=1 Tax=Massilibacteroides sp. TaxID=2034766 RepID=UPI0026134F0C|nr:hypothetical protein [Massilibacteroides sp.]MDD4515801.1 hypothetical protein [Massilibacteroides sp.]